MAKSDNQIWDDLFQSIPDEWKAAEPSVSMVNCLNLFKEHKCNNILDLGCGPGLWSIYLGKHDFNTYGIDFSTNAIDFARKWAKDENIDCAFEVGSIDLDLFPDTKFDGVLAAKILENVPPDVCKATVDLMHEKLNPQGVVYALFNPSNYETPTDDSPLSGSTFIRYDDEDVEGLFSDFSLVSKSEVEFQFREFIFKK